MFHLHPPQGWKSPVRIVMQSFIYERTESAFTNFFDNLD